MGVDYYNTLGISRNASDADIKKAYRKLSMKVFPGHNNAVEPDEKSFKEVSEAYEVLSDSKKRAVYDHYGEEGLKNSTVGTATDPMEIFEMFFGTRNPFAVNGGNASDPDAFNMKGVFGGKPSGPQKSDAETRILSVSLEDLYKGVTKKVKLTKQVLTGDGVTTKPDTKILQIAIKKGWKKGTQVTFAGEGDQGPGIVPGDVIFTIDEKPHPHFTRNKDDLAYTADITLEKALIGTNLEVVTLDGRTLPIPINDVVTPNYVKTIQGEGMPNSKTGEKGNLIIKFNIIFPTSLNINQKNLVKQVFSPQTNAAS